MDSPFFNPSFLGTPDAVNMDFDNAVEGPHIDIIHSLSAYDTLKTRVGLDGSILSQDLLENEPHSWTPADPSGLSQL